LFALVVVLSLVVDCHKEDEGDDEYEGVWLRPQTAVYLRVFRCMETKRPLRPPWI